MIGKEEMDRKQIFSYECSPTTTCSSASSTISSPIELNQDQYLPDFDDYYYKRMECENEHECYSVDGEEIKGEEFFWKEYEASVSNFCLNSVITVPPCNNTPATWSAGILILLHNILIFWFMILLNILPDRKLLGYFWSWDYDPKLHSWKGQTGIRQCAINDG